MPAPRYRPPADQVDPASLLAAVGQFCEWLAIRNYSPRTIAGYESHLLAFTAWATERGVTRPTEVTLPMLENYQRALFYRRRPSGAPLSVRAQVGHLVALRAMFRWLAKQRRILFDPASALELPRTRRLLPRGVLSVSEVEQVLATPDLTSLDGLRDRAILETLYSTAIRAQEAAGLVRVRHRRRARHRARPGRQRPTRTDGADRGTGPWAGSTATWWTPARSWRPAWTRAGCS